MHEPGLSFETLLRYEEQEAQRWEKFFQEHPQALELPIDIAETSSVRDFLVHIFAVEYRNAERLLGEAHTPNEKFDRRSIQVIFDIGRNARAKMRHYLAQTNAQDFERPRDLPSMTAGKIWASPQKIAAHALIHGVRHWAQLATVLRGQGYPQDWFHDMIYSGALE